MHANDASPPPALVLASASPRRRSLLAEAGFTVHVHPAAIDERVLPGEEPSAHVGRLALEKGERVAKEIAGDLETPVIISGDTVVVLDGEILGKPNDPADARAMLARLSDTTHEVRSGWCVRRGARVIAGVETTRIVFRALTPAEIETYVATGEPLDKAGAYGIQGGAAAFVTTIDGDLTNVIGLPVGPVVAAIEELLGRDER